MFPSRRQGGRAVVDVDFFWVSIERDLDFLWIGFLGVNFKDLTKPIRFRFGFDSMDVLA